MLAVASLIVILVLQLFTAPSLIQLIEQASGRNLSDQAIIRIRLALGLAVAATSMFIVWIQVPSTAVQAKLATFILLCGLAFSVATLLLGKADFFAEESRMTGATGCVLLLASLAAYGNYRAYTRHEAAGLLVRALWALLAVVFLAAALDELFMLHERVGYRLDQVLGGAHQSGGPVGATQMQDIITLAYAAGGLAFTLFLVRTLHPRVAPAGGVTAATLLAAAILYLISVLLDSFDWLLANLDPTLDLRYLANSLEEVLELLAAGLFLSAFLATLLGIGGGLLLHRATSPLDESPDRRRVVLQSSSAVGFLVLVVVLIHAGSAPPEGTIGAAGRTDLTVVSSRRTNPSLNPDGIAVAAGTLYIANDRTSSVTAVRPDGQSFTLADRMDGLLAPESIAVAPDGTVYVTDDGARAIFRIRPDGVTRILEQSGGLRSPKGIAIDAAGVLYVSDAETNGVLRHDQSGLSCAASFVGIGTPEELAFDSRGTLYVIQESPPRIYKVEPRGKPSVFADESTGLEAPESIAVVDEHIYVADSQRGAILRFTGSGVQSQVVQLTMPLGRSLEGLAVDERGNTYFGVRRGLRSMIGKAMAAPSAPETLE